MVNSVNHLLGVIRLYQPKEVDQSVMMEIGVGMQKLRGGIVRNGKHSFAWYVPLLDYKTTTDN
jgi:hypothetical protein